MSFDLFVFERRSCINTSLDIFSYQEKFTEYTEDKDYNSLNGCSDVISSWAKKMFEKFPPMNGEYAHIFFSLRNSSIAFLWSISLLLTVLSVAFADKDIIIIAVIQVIPAWASSKMFGIVSLPALYDAWNLSMAS